MTPNPTDEFKRAAPHPVVRFPPKERRLIECGRCY